MVDSSQVFWYQLSSLQFSLPQPYRQDQVAWSLGGINMLAGTFTVLKLPGA